MFGTKEKAAAPGDLHELADITAELDRRLNDRSAAGQPALNYQAETIALAIREQTATLAALLARR